MPILYGTYSNLPDWSTKNTGCSSIVSVDVLLCCYKSRLLYFYPQKSWLGLASDPFLPGWCIKPSPFLHGKVFPWVQPWLLIFLRGGEGTRWRQRLHWFFAASRCVYSTQGKNILQNYSLQPIPTKMMCHSGWAISCRFTNIIFLVSECFAK